MQQKSYSILSIQKIIYIPDNDIIESFRKEYLESNIVSFTINGIHYLSRKSVQIHLKPKNRSISDNAWSP